MKMNLRIRQLLAQLNQGVFEKEEVISFTLLSAIAGESIFLLGAPGVAKSLISRRLKYAFQNANSFEYLMNRFSTPDEIFGPVSISKLKDEDKYERLTNHYLPDAEVVFLDEIWKAGPSIQNALLTVLNEKVYRNGAQEIKIKMQGLVSASNELPAKGEGLEALWDRFLVRYIVDNVQDKGNFNRMISEELDSYEDNVNSELKISKDEFYVWQKEIDKVKVPAEVFSVIHSIREQIEKHNTQKAKEEKNVAENMYVSDRRWRKIVRILRTSAFLNGRNSIDLMDCVLIVFCIWDNPQQIKTISGMVENAVKENGFSVNVNQDTIQTIITEWREEIRNETEKEMKISLGEERETIDNQYYVVEGLEKYANGNRILMTDFNRRMPDKELYVPIFDDANQIIANIFIKSIPKHKNGVLIDVNNCVSGTTKLKDVQRGERLFKTLLLKQNQIYETQLVMCAPNPLLVEDWDTEATAICQHIDMEIAKIENYRKQQTINLNNNLFVDKRFGKWIEINLVQTLNSLQKLKLDVKSIQNEYNRLVDLELSELSNVA